MTLLSRASQGAELDCAKEVFMSEGMSHARRAGSVTIAVFFSRIFGLVREVVLNNLIGPGRALDAFLLAFRIPNLLRDLLAEGALSNAFVSVFSKKLEKEGKEAAFELANKVVTLLLALMSVIVAVGILIAPWIVSALGAGFEDAQKRELAIELTRILFPFILFVSLAALLMGLLNSLGSFFLPASASTVFNIASIIFGLLFAWMFDPAFGERAIYGFAFGTLLGGVAQMACQIPKAWSMGYRPMLKWDTMHPDVREIGRLMLPAVVGGAAVQINVLVNTTFASFLPEGTITCLSNAFRLMQLPIGLFGVAIATVTLPTIARHAAQDNRAAFRSKLARAFRHALALGLPAATGLAVLAVPVVRMIFERGRFSAEDTLTTALGLQGYAIGLAAYASIKVLTPAFIAHGDPNTPLRVSLIGIGLNLVFNTVFVFVLKWGIFGLALSTSLVALINLTQLSWKMRQHLGGFESRALFSLLLRLTISCAVMALTVWSVAHALDGLVVFGFLGNLIQVFLLVLCGAASFLSLGWALRVQETRELLGALFARFLKKGRG